MDYLASGWVSQGERPCCPNLHFGLHRLTVYATWSKQYLLFNWQLVICVSHFNHIYFAFLCIIMPQEWMIITKHNPMYLITHGKKTTVFWPVFSTLTVPIIVQMYILYRYYSPQLSKFAASIAIVHLSCLNFSLYRYFSPQLSKFIACIAIAHLRLSKCIACIAIVHLNYLNW